MAATDGVQVNGSPPPVGVAVVGAGYWGPNLVRNVLASPETDLHWIIDLDVEKAGRLVGGRGDISLGTSIEDALADPRVQAIAVATPPASHLPLALAALRSGRHVLVEKPLATNAADGQTLVDEAEARGLVLMCDHTFCYTPVVRAIRDLVDSGRLGDLHYIDSIRVNLGLVQSDVDVFWDLAPHDLSILDFILPDGVRPTHVSAQGADPIGAGQSCIGYLTMPLSSGGIAHVTVNWLSPSKIRQTVVAGSKQMLVWDDMKPYQRLAVVDCGVELERRAVDDEKRQLMVDYRMGDMVIPALNETGEALSEVIGEFVASIRENRAPLTDGKSGVRILRVLEAASASLRSSGTLVEIEEWV